MNLNGAIQNLDENSNIYFLYNKLYEGFLAAQNETPLSFDPEDYYLRNSDNEIVEVDGVPQIDTVAISEDVSSYTEIATRNSAYLFASAIMDAVGAGGESGANTELGYIIRTGDAMSGPLSALHGFTAGLSGNIDLEITQSNISLNRDTAISGALKLSSYGIYFNGEETISCNSSNDTLSIVRENIVLDGNVEMGDVVVDEISVGDLSISGDGIVIDGHDYYHSGNSNLDTVDWTMKDGTVFGSLAVSGSVVCTGGFSLGRSNSPLMVSKNDDRGDYVSIASDLSLDGSICLGDDIVLWKRKGVNANETTMSLSAPGLVLNLGDTGGSGGADTQYISLQSDLRNYTGNKVLVTKEGVAYFSDITIEKASGVVLGTYQNGISFPKQIVFGANNSTKLFDEDGVFNVSLKDLRESSSGSVLFSVCAGETFSIYRDHTQEHSSATNFSTESEFFSFYKPIESTFFSIKKENCYTKLEDNALFLNDDGYIKGVSRTPGEESVGGLCFYGNGYFVNDIGSREFSSGFAGNGWAIKSDTTYGGIHATVDSLTVRKKMRIYEMEVQNSTSSNGSFWVSDSCSGDIVEEL